MIKKFSILDIQFFTDTTFRIRTERPEVKIIAGQCFNIGIPGLGINREYSMYSDANGDHLDFLIKSVDDGSLTPLLKNLKIGDYLEIDGPYGDFIIKEPNRDDIKYIFIGTGTGIAPFHSFVQTYPKLNYQIIHGVRNFNEQYDADFFGANYIPCISNHSDKKKSIRVTDYLKNNPVNPKDIFYLCGNRNMIIEVFDILRGYHVHGDNIITEVFF